jgi:xanthine/uracil permease
MPDERLPWGQTIVSGLQHGVAMAGGTIIAPLVMGFNPNPSSPIRPAVLRFSQSK